MREKILGIASEQFSQYGVRAITMEDIARLAGISKKTIYQEFKDKKQLVKEAFSLALKEDQDRLNKIMEAEDGVIEIQKYFPEVWDMFNEFKEEIIVTDIINVIEKGKGLGYFRSEINAKILANMRIDQINSSMGPLNKNRGDFSLLTLHVEMLDHFLHGIFTEKGRQAYLQKQNSN
jgi:AcrR family transcriptional regulator